MKKKEDLAYVQRGKKRGIPSWLISDPLPKNSLARNLRSTFLGLASILLLLGIIGTGGLIYSDITTSSLINRVQPLIAANDKMLIRVLDLNTDVRNYLRTDQSAYLTSYRSDTKDLQSVEHGLLQIANHDAGVFQAVQRESLSAATLMSTYQQATGLVSQNPITPQRESGIVLQINQPLSSFRNAWSAANSTLIKQQHRAQHTISLTLLITTIVTILVILVGLALGIQRTRDTRRRLRSLLERLTDTLSRLGKGEEHVRAPLEGFTEEQVIADAINSMAEQKENLVGQLETQYEHEKELREKLETEQAVRMGLSATLYPDLDVASALQRTVNSFGPALHADRALVRIFEDHHPGEILTEWHSRKTGPATELITDDLSLGELRSIVYREHGVISDSLITGAVVAVSDVSRDDRLPPEVRKDVLATGLGAFLTAPVMGTDGPEALLVAVMEGKSRNWTERDVQVASAMANGLAATLTAIRLYEQERSNLMTVKELDQAKDVFLASISHELRTPLTSIMGYLELLSDEVAAGQFPKSYSRMLDAIDRNAKKLLDLIDNILTASTIESGRLHLSRQRIHITPVLMRAAETMMPHVDIKGIKLEIMVADDLPDINADPALLERALVNIVSNAVKFTPTNGVISVNAYRLNGDLAISITDSGTGIAEQDIDKLFTKFYRTSAARENAVQGTGLGLSIVKAIVEEHDGSISVSSHLGEGTTFTILLPAIKSEVSQLSEPTNRS